MSPWWVRIFLMESLLWTKFSTPTFRSKRFTTSIPRSLWRALRAARQKADYIESRQIPQLDLYFSFTGGPMLREIEARFGARHAVPLYCSFDPAKYRRTPVNRDFACDLSYMGTYAPDRQPKLRELLCAPAQQFNDQEIYGGRPAISSGYALARQCATYSASQSAVASRVLFLIQIHIERYTARYGDGGLLALRPPVRSGGLRNNHRLGQLARARFVFCAGHGNSSISCTLG